MWITVKIQTRGIWSVTRDFGEVSRPIVDAKICSDNTGSAHSH